MSEDHINHPSHYNQGKIEVIEFIEDQNFNYHLGSAVAYICRCRYKGSHIDDLKKAIWYLEREISRLDILAADEHAKYLMEPKQVIKKLNLPPDFKIEPGQVILVDKSMEFPSNSQLEIPLEFKDTSKVGAKEQAEHTLSSCAFNGCYRCQTPKEMYNDTKT